MRMKQADEDENGNGNGNSHEGWMTTCQKLDGVKLLVGRMIAQQLDLKFLPSPDKRRK